MGGDYGWGDLAITNDGHILFARNDGDSTGTIWELDIVTDSFAPLEYGAANGDLYVACNNDSTESIKKQQLESNVCADWTLELKC